MFGPVLQQSLRSRGIQSLTITASKSPARIPTGGTPQRLCTRVDVRNFSDRPSPSSSDAPKGDASRANSSPGSTSQQTDAGDFASRTSEQSAPIGPKSRLGTWFTALLLAGLGMTAYGIGEIWGAMTIWPKEVRGDLRQGLREDVKGERDLAARYLYRAWETSKKMTLEQFGIHPYLKTTGIAITLAGALEADGKQEQAYQIYQEALNLLQEGPGNTTSRLRTGLSAPERLRCVAIAHKLGELAEELHKPEEEEEKWLVYSVETVLRDIMGATPAATVSIEKGEGKEELSDLMGHLKLPVWATSHDIAAPFEALATFYSKAGKISYAMPLYLQAVSILIPPPPQVTPADDQCRGAQLMGNISELILRTSINPEAVVQAEAWANKGLEVASRVRKSTFTTHPVCEQAYAMMLYNLAMIRDMSGDQEKARQLFTQSLVQYQQNGLSEGVENAERAIRDLGKRAEVPTGFAKDS